MNEDEDSRPRDMKAASAGWVRVERKVRHVRMIGLPKKWDEALEKRRIRTMVAGWRNDRSAIGGDEKGRWSGRLTCRVTKRQRAYYE